MNYSRTHAGNISGHLFRSQDFVFQVGGQCNCKTNVTGRVCDMCKPLHFNLTPNNPDGCTRCDCGTGTKSCDTNTGACTCKNNVEVCIYNLTINKQKVGKSILLSLMIPGTGI